MSTLKQPVVYSRLELNGRKGRQFVGYAVYREKPDYPHAGGIIAPWEEDLSPSSRGFRRPKINALGQ